MLLCIALAFLPFSSAWGQIQVNEVAISAGIGSEIYDSSPAHGLGAIWIDYDNDGFPDLFVPNGANLPSHLYHNEGNGTFSNQDALLPSGMLGELTGAMFADYDNDGDQDIYITVANITPEEPDGGANILLQNQWVENGNTVSTPLFIDVAAAAGVDNLPNAPFGALPGRASYTGAWLDYDRDSCIDLFVGNMDWDEAGTETNANQLYKNNCDGTFTDVTVSSGVDTGDNNDHRPTLAFFGGLLTPGDIDPDLYIVNVHDPSPFHHDLIYQNNGDGTFTEFGSTMAGFGDDSGAGMGTAVADIDLDGDWDIYLSDLPDPGNEPVAEGNPLYLGNPDGTWSENAAPAAGVESFSSWGVNFVDLDQDGFEDLFVGTIAPNNAVQSIYRNNGDGTFDDVTGSAGFVTGFPARGSAVADYDRDGDMDIVQVNLNDRIILFENVSQNQGNWLQVKLEATVSNRSAIGALVEATTGSTTRMRQINGGASAHSQDELLIHFGLSGATNVDELKITWPSGTVQTLTNVGVNQMLTVTETGSGSGTLVALPSSVDFGQQGVGTTSAPMQITLDNTGTAALDVSSVSISGVDAGDFSHDFVGPITIPGGGSSTFNATFSPSAGASPLEGEILYRVNAGGSLVSDWTEDSDASPSGFANTSETLIESTSTTITLDASVPAGTPMELFQTSRSDASKGSPDMEWDFPVTAGSELTVRLFFAEIVRCQASSHVFDVEIEGAVVLDDYDPFSDVGCETGVMKEFVVTPSDDNLDINFPLAGNNRPSTIAAIEVETAGSTGGGDDIRNAQIDITHTGSNPMVSVSLTGEATDGGGGNIAPTAAFSFSASDLTVSFTDASSDSDGSVVAWSWDFGNGVTSTGQNPDVTYGAAGTYTVMLTVTDDLGATGNTSQDVTVTDGGTGGATMHIASVTTVLTRQGGEGIVEATVLIVDENGTPVENATVSGTFSDDVTGTDTQVSDVNGEAALESDVVSARPQNIGFCVDDVTHATLTYDPTANTDPTFDCSTAAPSEAGDQQDRVAKSAAGLPEEFALHTNYPNPFNPTTTIRFDLPEASDVRLEVYDMMGRRVATLINGQMSAGRYEATWNALSDSGSHVASGVYLYSMQAGSFKATYRMVLMK